MSNRLLSGPEFRHAAICAQIGNDPITRQHKAEEAEQQQADGRQGENDTFAGKAGHRIAERFDLLRPSRHEARLEQRPADHAVDHAARGVVYGVIGWSLFKAGFMSAGAEQVKTLGDAVASLAGEGIVFTLTAIGLLLFGLFSLVLARYRIIPDLGADGRVPKFRA